MATALITDDELLALGIATDALGAIGLTVRNLHRQAASDWARGHLAVRHSAAESDSFAPPAEVKEAVAARAAHTLLGRRGYSPTMGNDKAIEQRYQQTLDWLERIRTGKAQLVGYPSDRQAPKVGGSGTSSWELWRSGGPTDE